VPLILLLLLLSVVSEPGGLHSIDAAILRPLLSMSIRINATVHEARAAAGHTKEQWDRFYVGSLRHVQR
jgi:hypothetical protein